MDELKEANQEFRKRHIRKPFEVTRFDEDRLKDTGRNLTIRFNDEECQRIDQAKELLNTDLDGKAVKILMECGWNAMHSLLSQKTIAWLSSQDRTHKRSRTTKKTMNAMQKQNDLQGIAPQHPDDPAKQIKP